VASSLATSRTALLEVCGHTHLDLNGRQISSVNETVKDAQYLQQIGHGHDDEDATANNRTQRFAYEVEIYAKNKTNK
jgi:hypothetical protein